MTYFILQVDNVKNVPFLLVLVYCKATDSYRRYGRYMTEEKWDYCW